MRRRPTSAILFVVVGAALLAGCGGDAGDRGTASGGDDRGTYCADGKVRVSYSGPLSGSAADFGQQQVRGIELAIEKVNAEGGVSAGALKGCKVELLGPFDDQASTTSGVQIATNLTREDQLLAYMGNVNSPVVLAVEPVLARAGIPMLVSYASAPEITSQGFTNVFRTILNGHQYGAEIAKFLVEDFGRKRIAAAWVNDAYGQPQITALRDRVPKLGGDLVVDYSYETGQTDFAAFVSRAKAANADGIALLGNYGEGALITEQLASAGLEADTSVTIVGAAGNNSPQFVEIAGDAAEGVYFGSNWNPGGASGEEAEFVRRYREAYDEPPSEPAATGYDSLRLFAKGVAAGGTNREKLIEVLRRSSLEGITGNFKINPEGQAVGLALSLLQVKDGNIEPAAGAAAR
jgi:branched-chain amino acid transport system substrate-binding protein